MISTYAGGENLTELEETIQLGSDQGLSLVDIEYLDDGEYQFWIGEYFILSLGTSLSPK